MQDEYQKDLEKQIKKVLERHIQTKRSRLIANYKVLIYAFCGASYDGQFLFKSSKLKFYSVVNSSGLIKISFEGGYVELLDSARITGPGISLAKLCKDFDLPKEFSKTEFPHDFMTKERLNYIGPPPEAKYWTSGKIPEEHLGKTFDLKAVSIKYQVLDTVSQCIILHKLYTNILDVTGCSIFDFITGSSLAYYNLFKHVPTDLVKVCSNRSDDAWLAESEQGGRSFPHIGFFMSKSYYDIMETDFLSDELSLKQEIIKEHYDKCNDYLHDMDMISLYPSVMILEDYPVGQPYWADGLEGRETLEQVRDAINACDENFRLGSVECEVSFRNPENQMKGEEDKLVIVYVRRAK